MNTAIYEDLMDYEDEPLEYIESDEAESYDAEDMDDLLDALVGAVGESEDLTERRRRKAKAKAKARARARLPVPTATGRPAFRPPVAAGFVTQKQLQDALARVGTDVKRNAAGIKTVNTRMNGLTTRLDGVVSVNVAQSTAINRLDRRSKAAGALELAQALGPQGIDVFQLFKGIVTSGVVGDQRGALGNPWVLGGIGVLLRQPGVLGGVFQQQTANVP